MKRTLIAAFCALAVVATTRAHFLFVVPEAGGASAKVFLSETLRPDPGVDAGIIAGAKLFLRDGESGEKPLSLTRSGDIFTTALPGSGDRLVRGFVDLGVMKRSATHLLLYYPKTILGDPFRPSARVGEPAVVELIPIGRPGEVRLQLTVRGEPAHDAEVVVLTPSGEEKRVKTDAAGETEAFAETGRYGAWARFWEDKAGERDGERYEQVRHYAMLVFDADAMTAERAAPRSTAERFGTLPEATSSFGAATADGWLYVYGGHVSPTHDYSTEAVSGRFHRTRLGGAPQWKELPGGPGVQGMNLAAHDGRIYRVGGMAPRNKPGEPADNRSIDSVARFDPEMNRWEELPPLPAPRSSHDVAVVGDRLFVVGGWEMKDGGQEWFDHMLVMDLGKEDPSWQTVPQPFRRRALMAAAHEGKMYVVGGFTDKSEVSRDVSIYDPRTQKWSEGPSLPDGERTLGFAPAVGVHQGRLYVSVSDGRLLRLSESGEAWEEAGRATPRIAHRLAAADDAVLVIGGAAEGDNFDLIEAVAVDR